MRNYFEDVYKKACILREKIKFSSTKLVIQDRDLCYNSNLITIAYFRISLFSFKIALGTICKKNK